MSKATYPLQLPVSIKKAAQRLAKEDGVSLNIAIVVQAFWKLGRTAVKTKWLAVVAFVAAVLHAMHVHEILTLVIAAGLAAAPIIYRGLSSKLVSAPLFTQIRGVCLRHAYSAVQLLQHPLDAAPAQQLPLPFLHDLSEALQPARDHRPITMPRTRPCAGQI